MIDSNLKRSFWVVLWWVIVVMLMFTSAFQRVSSFQMEMNLWLSTNWMFSFQLAWSEEIWLFAVESMPNSVCQKFYSLEVEDSQNNKHASLFAIRGGKLLVCLFKHSLEWHERNKPFPNYELRRGTLMGRRGAVVVNNYFWLIAFKNLPWSSNRRIFLSRSILIQLSSIYAHAARRFTIVQSSEFPLKTADHDLVS